MAENSIKLLRVTPGLPELILILCLGLYAAGNRTFQCKVHSRKKKKAQMVPEGGRSWIHFTGTHFPTERGTGSLTALSIF